MTFDFAPHWMDTIGAVTEYSGTVSKSVAPPLPTPPARSPLAPPAPCAPAQPDMAQLAALVEELFAEGTLSYDQLRSLSGVPEMAALLDGALDSVPAGRRLTRTKR